MAKQQKQQKGTRRELLDVPDVSALERRLNVVQPEAAGGAPAPAAPAGGKPVTSAAPRSAVLDRLQRFLPQMQAANTQLQHEMQARPAQAFDIEHVDDEEDTAAGYIEMDLACGVLDLLDEGAVQAAEQSMQGAGPDLLGAAATACSSDSEDSSEDDSSDDDDDAEEQQGTGTRADEQQASAEAEAQQQQQQQRRRQPEPPGSAQQQQQQHAGQGPGPQGRGGKRSHRPLVEEL